MNRLHSLSLKPLLNSMLVTALASAPLLLSQAASAEKRFMGVYNSAGQPVYLEVDSPLSGANTIVPAGHLPGADVSLPPWAKSRLGTSSAGLDNESLQIADKNFKKKTSKMGRKTDVVSLALEIAPLYKVDPAAVVAAIIGELTFNNEFQSAMQDRLAKIPGESLFTGAKRVASLLNNPAVAECRPQSSDYWTWICINNVWNSSLNFSKYPTRFNRNLSAQNFLPIDYSEGVLHGVLRPVTGVSYGPAQMSLALALSLMADVNVTSRGSIPHYKIDNMSGILKSVTEVRSAIHLVSATMARVTYAYQRFARVDISRNIGLQVTLFNLGGEVTRALKLAQDRKTNPSALPRENYLGWFANQHEAEIRKTLSKYD